MLGEFGVFFGMLVFEEIGGGYRIGSRGEVEVGGRIDEWERFEGVEGVGSMESEGA